MFLSILIVCLFCAFYTAYRIIGQGTYSLKQKLLIVSGSLFLFLIPLMLRQKGEYSGFIYTFIYTSAYFLFIIGALFFCLIIVRDFIWFVLCVREMAKNILPRKYVWKNPVFLKRTNYFLLIVSFLIGGYSLYCGLKVPAVKETVLSSAKIEEPLKIVVLSDLHLSRTFGLSKMKKIVSTVNEINPDIVLLPGDTIDDNIYFIEPMLKELKNIKSVKGVYATAGNHEFYVGHEQARTAFMLTGIQYLSNTGVDAKKNVYLAGVPDEGSSSKNDFSVDVEKALQGAKQTDFKILMTHRPKIVEKTKGLDVDLVIAGHTHGGQIFPFHVVSWLMNGYLAGLYHQEDTILYVTRGAGQWGPQMRLLAPSEISVINVQPVVNLASVKTDEKQPNPTSDVEKEEVVYPVDKTKDASNFVKDALTQKDDVKEDVVTLRLEKEQKQADVEAEKEATVDEDFEEAKASLDDVVKGVMLDTTKKQLLEQKEINKKLEIEIQQLRVDFEKNKDDMNKVIIRQKAAIKLLEAEKKVLKDELVEQKLLLKSERKTTQEILATQKKLLMREREIAKKAFKLQNELLSELNAVKKELDSYKQASLIQEEKKKVVVDTADLKQKEILPQPTLQPFKPTKQVDAGYNQEQRREEKFANMEVIYHADGSVTRRMIKTVIIEYPTYFSTVKSVANYTTTPLEERTSDPVVIENALRQALKLPLIQG